MLVSQSAKVAPKSNKSAVPDGKHTLTLMPCNSSAAGLLPWRLEPDQSLRAGGSSEGCLDAFACGTADGTAVGTRVLISLWDSLMFGRVPKNGVPFLGTCPNISESHSEISTRVPFVLENDPGLAQVSVFTCHPNNTCPSRLKGCMCGYTNQQWNVTGGTIRNIGSGTCLTVRTVSLGPTILKVSGYAPCPGRVCFCPGRV